MYSELYHYGIKDMKWGIRRFQNEDGTLTDLGKQRYQKGMNSLSENINASRFAKKIEREHMENMSNEELSRKTNRLKLENSYAEEMRKLDSYSTDRAKVNMYIDAALPIIVTSASAMALVKIGAKMLKGQDGEHMYNDIWTEIYHTGVKGQKWGKRQYQNPDGSLTPLGRQHYLDSKSKTGGSRRI